jgi:hypothetical protein
MLDTAETDDRRLDLLREWVNEEHLSLMFHLSTLSSVPANFPTLLELLSVIIKEIHTDEDKQLDVFLIICSLYRKPLRLEIEHKLYLRMVSYIVDHPKATPIHAIGFLKVAFVNDVSLVGCSSKAIKEFDNKFISHIDSFYSKLCDQLHLNERPFRVLPHTCMFLSGPVISYLKARVEPTAFLPPQMYEQFLAVLVYSFTEEYDHADNYLSMLKEKLRRWPFIECRTY